MCEYPSECLGENVGDDESAERRLEQVDLGVGASVTIAFFHGLVTIFGSRPRRTLPRRFWTATRLTLTLKSSSTARRMSALVASVATSKE